MLFVVCADKVVSQFMCYCSVPICIAVLVPLLTLAVMKGVKEADITVKSLSSIECNCTTCKIMKDGNAIQTEFINTTKLMKDITESVLCMEIFLQETF